MRIINKEMHNIGDIAHGNEIGRSSNELFIWVACVDCSKERWIRLKWFRLGKSRLCYRCSHNHPLSMEHKVKIGKAMQGHQLSAETKRKIGEAMQGKLAGDKNPFFGKFGDQHPGYVNGQSKFPYPLEFNRRLKDFIRKRDNYTCQLCNKPEPVSKSRYLKRLRIHHIDYDKNNLIETNLISLCNSCNSKVNSNRDHWQAFFTAKIVLVCSSLASPKILRCRRV